MVTINADNLAQLIQTTSTQLPTDVVAALTAAATREEDAGARNTLQLMLENVELAARRSAPLCQDTGCLIFFVDHPVNWPIGPLYQEIATAVSLATAHSYLRPNSVDSVSGQNPGNNLGAGFPQVHAHEWEHAHVRIRLLLKGGGSENVSTQYSLPDMPLQAGRDLAGVRRVLLNCVQRAGGQGCAPGILGVCIGGDRGLGYTEAKRQLLRSLDDVNPIPALAELEEQVCHDANQLGIGPLGLGGHTTLLGVKVGHLHRHPASYFVSVAYMCWECRRATLECYPNGEVLCYA